MKRKNRSPVSAAAERRVALQGNSPIFVDVVGMLARNSPTQISVRETPFAR
jgi:hypothetical protein